MSSNLTKAEIKIVNYNKKALSLSSSHKTEALSLYLKAELILNTHPSTKLQLLTYNNLACFYSSQKEHSKALQYLNQCQKLHPDNKPCKIFLIGSTINLASTLSNLTRHEDSISTLHKAQNLLTSCQNLCLQIICLYTMGLEYEFLQKISFAQKCFSDCKALALQVFEPNHKIFYFISQSIKNISSKQEESICVLMDKAPKIKSRRETSLKVKESVEKGEFCIKVDTTPWAEHDLLRFKSSSQAPKAFQSFSHRKKCVRMSQDLNKKGFEYMEGKLKGIGKKIVGLSGKLGGIEVAFRKGKKKSLERVQAAIKIQRAYRRYVREKKKKQKIFPFFMILSERKNEEKCVRSKKKGLLESIVFIQKCIRGFLVRKPKNSTLISTNHKC